MNQKQKKRRRTILLWLVRVEMVLLIAGAITLLYAWCGVIGYNYSNIDAPIPAQHQEAPQRP